MTKFRLVCVDCRKEGISLSRKASTPGPLCATHRKARKRNTSETRWAKHILTTYNLTATEYQAIYAFQGGRCAICRRATGASRRLAVEHDHATGQIMGLCCTVCNKYILGHLRRSIELMDNAIRYITNPPAFQVIGVRAVPKTAKNDLGVPTRDNKGG